MSISILLAEKIAQLFLILLMGYLVVRVGLLKPEDSRYLERVFAGGELDVAKTRKAVFDFFGGISTVVDYCAAAEKSFTPRKEFLEQLQGQYGLKAAAADWVLNSVISMGMSLNPDAKAVDNLRTNFEQQGGRVL